MAFLITNSKKSKISKINSYKIVEQVKAQEINWSNDLVGYFRSHGKSLGYDDYLITRLLKVTSCENDNHDPKRVNYLYDGENGKHTAAGFAMINKSTFEDSRYQCKGNRFNGIDNINCFYKIYEKNGLKDYKASYKCWKK